MTFKDRKKQVELMRRAELHRKLNEQKNFEALDFYINNLLILSIVVAVIVTFVFPLLSKELMYITNEFFSLIQEKLKCLWISFRYPVQTPLEISRGVFFIFLLLVYIFQATCLLEVNMLLVEVLSLVDQTMVL